MQFSELFPDLVDRSGIFDYLAKFINQKSQVVNITAIKDYDQIWQKHIIDSLMFLRTDLFQKSLNISYPGILRRFLDVGTGAGFPGLALAIAFLNYKLTFDFDLLDATHKKLNVIDEFILCAKNDGYIDLNQNTKTVWGRAEILNQTPKFKTSYDVVFARSVAYIDKLIAYTIPFVKPDGHLVLYKSQSQLEKSDLDKIIKSNNLALVQEFDYKIDNSDRVIYIIKKST